MQYRYHEWTDKILSKRTAESIGSSTLVGLKCGFDTVSIVRPNGAIPAKVTISHKVTPSNGVTDRLHLSAEQQGVVSYIGSVITPDCVITTEDTPLEFEIATTEWNSKPIHAWALVATHNYIEIPESSTTLQGGSPTTYTLVDLMDTITSMGLEEFTYGYLMTDNAGKLITLVNSLNSSLLISNSVVISVITNVVSANPNSYNYYPVYNNVTPLTKVLTQWEYKELLDSMSEVLTAMATLKTELEQSMADLESRVDTKLEETLDAVSVALEEMETLILTTLRREISLVDIKLVNPMMEITSTMPNSENKILIAVTIGAYAPNPNHPSLNGMGLELPPHIDIHNVQYASNIGGGLAFEVSSGGSEVIDGNLYSFIPFKRVNYWMKGNPGMVPTITYTFECHYDNAIVNPILTAGYIKKWANLIFTLHSQQLSLSV